MTDKPEIITPPQKAKPADPRAFNDEVFQTICDRMADGQGLREICEDPQMPSRQTFLRWIEKDTGRQNRYQAAREALMDWYGEEILTIAWDSSKDTIPADGKKPARCDNEWVNRSRLKVDTLKFLMAKLHPKRYGDRLPESEGARDAEQQRLQVSWEKPITRIELVGVSPEFKPITDDNGNLVDSNNVEALCARIRELEEKLGMKQTAPKQLTYDPGPLPSRTEADILYSVAQAIKRNVPKADQRPPEEVLSEVMTEFEKVLQAKYNTPAEPLHFYDVTAPV